MVIFCIVLWVISIIGVSIYYWRESKYEKISFKETLDLTSLPIITFRNNGQKLNFVVDTGANRSVINDTVVSRCEYTRLNTCNSLQGLDGIERQVENVSMELIYHDKRFQEVLQVSNMDPIFDEFRTEKGVQIHGILGNSFFEKYNYVIDFKDYVVYSKK